MNAKTCCHEIAALFHHVCSDCIIERMYNTRIIPLHEIMWEGPLNVWTREN